MNPVYPGALAILLYVAGCLLQFRALSVRDPKPSKRLLAISLPAVVLHGLCLALVIYSDTGIDLSLFTIASLIAFAATLTILAAALAQPQGRLENLYLLVFPFSIIAIAGSLAFGGTKVRQVLEGGLLAHLLVSIFAYTLLTVAAFQAILLWVQERHIRHKEPIGVIRILPPLETLEVFLFQLLMAGFALLTVSIAIGFAFLDNVLARDVVYHTVLATASWCIYGGLLIGHRVFGWRGTMAARWTLAAFALLVIGYFGSRFVLEFVLGAR
ncbi:MAG: cytochrome c biogenesis protein CcsA [Gammaproteobacteria bacterium]|nr:cytochrome c biogenesis protein CcsA [Gammaproteobacteria bacterium]